MARDSKETIIESGSGDQPLVLVIDDEDDARDVVARVLERNGYRTLRAPDGESGLAIFQQKGNDINLVLLDWNLPGASGKDTLAALLKLRPSLRVILVTGDFLAPSDPRASQDTVSILLKPFTPTELMMAVRTVLGA